VGASFGRFVLTILCGANAYWLIANDAQIGKQDRLGRLDAISKRRLLRLTELVKLHAIAKLRKDRLRSKSESGNVEHAASFRKSPGVRQASNISLQRFDVVWSEIGRSRQQAQPLPFPAHLHEVRAGVGQQANALRRDFDSPVVIFSRSGCIALRIGFDGASQVIECLGILRIDLQSASQIAASKPVLTQMQIRFAKELVDLAARRVRGFSDFHQTTKQANGLSRLIGVEKAPDVGKGVADEIERPAHAAILAKNMSNSSIVDEPNLYPRKNLMQAEILYPYCLRAQFS
jgi:hypothetical protein